jgi:hypothetical protein
MVANVLKADKPLLCAAGLSSAISARPEFS